MIFQPVIKGGSSQSSLPTQTKTVTPGYFERLVTKDPGYGDLRVIVEGDEDLLSKNIKKDVSIFGVTGSYVGGVEDRLQDVEAFPEPPKTLPNEAWLVTPDGVQDVVPLVKQEYGVTVTKILIVDDHTEVSNPVDVSATGAGPAYADSNDVWMYIAGNWLGFCTTADFPYKGIVGTRPNQASAYGIYIVNGQTIASTGTVNKDYVYKITTTKNHITFWAVMDGEVINVNEMASQNGATLDGTYIFGKPEDLSNPIVSTQTSYYVYIWTTGTEYGASVYMSGYGWQDACSMMGLPPLKNSVLDSPPTADMEEGSYTMTENVTDKIKFGIPISEAELYQLKNNEWKSVDETIQELETQISDVVAYKNFFNHVELTGTANGIELTKGDSSENIRIHKSVTSIGYEAFYSSTPLKSVIFDEDSQLVSIGDRAFAFCAGLTNIVLPNSLTSIGHEAFRGCTGLASMSIPDSVTHIEDAFYQCNSSIYNTYENVYYLGNELNSYRWLIKPIDSSISSCLIHQQCKFIAMNAFDGCSSLTAVTFDENSQLISIGRNAFYFCTNLTSITIPDSVTSIGYSAFGYCSTLASITIPDSVTSIGNHAFSSCTSLTSITIPASVTSIGSYAFDGCDSLTSVVIGDSVTTIGDAAFYNCKILISITFQGTMAQWNAITKGELWDNFTGNYTIHCTDGDIAKG